MYRDTFKLENEIVLHKKTSVKKDKLYKIDEQKWIRVKSAKKKIKLHPTYTKTPW